MTKKEMIESAIIDTLKVMGKSFAYDVERFPAVAQACRAGKLKCRKYLELLRIQGRVQSDQARPKPLFWVDAA